MIAYKLYQVNSERDTNGVMFLSFDSLPKFQGSDKIDSTIYDMAYEGQEAAFSLEAIYTRLNTDHPEDYRCRSMSKSDVVEVVESDAVKPGFYYCDSFGFQEVNFSPELTQEFREKNIRVVYLELGKQARIVELDSSLAGLQKAVGGDIEAVYPFEDTVCIVCNEEGKINGLPLNRAIRAEPEEKEMSYGELCNFFRTVERSGTGQHAKGYIVFTEDSFKEPYPVESRTYVVSSDNKAFRPNMGGYSIYGAAIDGSDPCVRLEQYIDQEYGGEDGWKIERCYVKEPAREIIDIIAGPCFICDCSGENFGSLSPEQQKKYMEMFKNPERFASINGEIIAVPYLPTKKDQER